MFENTPLTHKGMMTRAHGIDLLSTSKNVI